MNIGKTNMKVGGKEFWLAVALGIVIVAAIVIAIMQFTGPEQHAAIGNDVYHFQCESCGHEFQVDREQELKIADAAMKNNEALPQDCGRAPAMPRTCKNPSCGLKDKARLQHYCPSCEKWYLPNPALGDPSAFVSTAEMPKDICTNCNTDVQEWYKQHVKK